MSLYLYILASQTAGLALVNCHSLISC